ncbi:capsular polysaccharide synthesis protein, partial [Lacticaseibacillus rhamnosus MTCC 5462]
ISLVIMPKMASEGKEAQKVVMKKSLEATVMLGTLFAVIIMAQYPSNLCHFSLAISIFR